MTMNGALIETRTWFCSQRRMGDGLASSIGVATFILAGCGGGSNTAAKTGPDTSSSPTGDSATETTAATNAAGDHWIDVQMIGSTRFDELLPLRSDMARNAAERV